MPTTPLPRHFYSAVFLLFLVNTMNRVWIVGSSLVHWAECRAHRERSKWTMLTSQKGSWHGQRGMRWNQLLPKIKTLLQMNPAHLGGNDLVSTHLGKLTKQAQSDVRALATLCPETMLIWSDVLPRIRYRGAFKHNKVEKTRKTSNSSMRAYTRKMGGKSVRHHQIQWNMNQQFRPDGVHLNDLGNDVLIGNFHDSICCFEKNLGVLEFPIPH